jgi:acylphosphatase
MSDRTVRISIRGRVQGVGYRAFLRAEAERCGVTGWVRNRRDGTVEAELTGSETAVSAALEAAGRGPPAGVVEHVEVVEAFAPETPERGVTVRPTC